VFDTVLVVVGRWLMPWASAVPTRARRSVTALAMEVTR